MGQKQLNDGVEKKDLQNKKKDSNTNWEFGSRNEKSWKVAVCGLKRYVEKYGYSDGREK